MKKIFNSQGWLILGLIFLIELFSIFTFYVPGFNNLATLIIALLVLILTLYRLDYGIFLLLIELFIGSKGYLFYFESQGTQISLRIILWLIVMVIWLVPFISRWLKERKFPWGRIKKSALVWSFGSLGVLVIFGLLNGLKQGHNFSNIFFDFNGWIYFSLLLPLYEVFVVSKNKVNNWQRLEQIFIISVSWLIIKTLILLYFFTHNIPSLLPDIYRWVRLSGVGEITPVSGGFFRIFFQSHIFLLLASPFLAWKLKEKGDWSVWIFLTLCWTGIIISLSRSFWLALLASVILVLIVIWQRSGIKTALGSSLKYLVILTMSLLLVLVIAKFPYPAVSGSFNLSLFMDRA
ncbi:MAG: hypothetical protein WCX80_03485, partial [Patescibacteria group bacterium]